MRYAIAGFGICILAASLMYLNVSNNRGFDYRTRELEGSYNVVHIPAFKEQGWPIEFFNQKERDWPSFSQRFSLADGNYFAEPTVQPSIKRFVHPNAIWGNLIVSLVLIGGTFTGLDAVCCQLNLRTEPKVVDLLVLMLFSALALALAFVVWLGSTNNSVSRSQFRGLSLIVVTLAGLLTINTTARWAAAMWRRKTRRE